MFKRIVAVVILVCFCFPVFATLDMSNAQPYSDSEFPKFALGIRRTETIFFGGLPFTFMVTNLVTSLANSNMNYWTKLGISAGAAGVIAITDLILGLVKKKK